MRPILELKNVTKCYAGGSTSEITPLLNVNFEAHEGERIVLLGKSGTGKSTFLNIAGGVDVPTSGNVIFAGRDIVTLPPRELAWYRRKEVGFIFQSFNLFSTLTVGENVMLPLSLLKIEDKQKARDILDSVGLNGTWDKFPEQLSGGEQQRVAIARALVKQPRLILADEPTGNLDIETGDGILKLMYNTSQEMNATLIMATHSPDALWPAHRLYRLKGGILEPADNGAASHTPGASTTPVLTG
jgi:putative ABC transport system ATP-binding protein